VADAQTIAEQLIADLAADPAFAGFVREGAALLVWDRSISRILWASPAALPLRNALTGGGNLATPAPSLERLRSLVASLSADQGIRLERMRLDPSRLAPPVTCACRLATLESGDTVLVTAIVGAVPKVAPRLQVVASADPQPDPEPAPSEPPVFRPNGTVRFVWQADAETRFTHVAPALAEVVGPMAGDIVGQTFADLTASVVTDEGGIAELFARRETFSGRPLLWVVDNTDLEVPVDWAGLPVYGPDKTLVGFRGFGLLRTDAARPRGAAAASGAASEGGVAEEVPTPAEVAPSGEPVPVEETSLKPSAPSEAENWFVGIRDRVAATLSGARAAVRSAEERGEGGSEGKPGPRARSPRAEAPVGLSHAERSAFREIARALGARFEDDPPGQPANTDDPPARSAAPVGRDRILERLPLGVLVHRGERILFANRLLMDMIGYDDLGRVDAEGGLARLFRGSPSLLQGEESSSALALSTRSGETLAVDVRLSTIEWDGMPATLMLVRKISEADARDRLRATEADLRLREARVAELESILDTATDGVIVLDETGRILSLNRSAEALFGYDQREVVGDAITVLLAPESHIIALDYLDGLRSSGVASLLNDGREVLGRVRQGGTIPLFMTMGRVNEGPGRKFCLVLRDITAFKKAEGELVAAKRAAEEASAQKSDLLAKISHEIRTPLNAIIGFAEVMLEERFGAIGNERYKDYLKDVHASGAHVISLVNDLLDLAKIEAGRMELSFTSVALNELVGATVTLLQQQASRDRIVMRTSFAPKLPPVVADERSVRQIVLNLVSNAIKFTDAGGQVIVSTAMTDRGEVAFRVRDTGIGMTDAEIESALEPFRQLATARKRGGTGLGLPLTKALVEANRGALQISSNPNEGTLVEVLFPPMRVLAD
jgi:PAS domain S-box-containing protein